MFSYFKEFDIEKGEKKKNWLKMTNDSGTVIKIPILIIKGLAEEPKILITAGIHGDEFEGVETIFRLFNILNPSSMNGTLIAIPIMNTISFQRSSRIAFYDLLDLNRSFPGNCNGFFTEQLAKFIVTMILDKLNPNLVVDLHGGGNHKFIGPIISCPENLDSGDENKLFSLAKISGIPLLWKSSGVSNSTFRAVSLNKKINTLIIEAGGGGGINTLIVEKEVTAITNIMKALKILSGKPEGLPSSYTIFGGFFIHSDVSGFLRRRPLNVGDKISSGACLGTIIDLHGNILNQVKSSNDGILISYRTTPKVNTGDWLFWVGDVLNNYATKEDK